MLDMEREIMQKRFIYLKNCLPLPRGTFHIQQLDRCFELDRRLSENEDGTRHVAQAHAPEMNT